MLVGIDKIKMGHGHNHSSDDQGAEPDESPAGMLGLMLIILVVVLLGLGIATKAFLDHSMAQQQALQLSIPNAQLTEMRAKELAELTNYDAVEAAPGRYKIPVDKAIEFLVKSQSINVK